MQFPLFFFFSFLCADLQTSISASKATLDAVYSDPMMNKTPYYLHAVMVHQGEASGGHYWAYTRKHPSLTIPPLTGTSSEQSSGGLGDTKGKVCTSTPSVAGHTGRTNYHTRLETGEIYTDAIQSPESMGTGDEITSVSSPCILVGPSTPSSDGQGGMEVEGEETGSIWTKFNDVSVSEVNWEEVKRESLGGMHSNTSAYCLVYIDKRLHENWLSNGEDEGREGNYVHDEIMHGLYHVKMSMEKMKTLQYEKPFNETQRGTV